MGSVEVASYSGVMNTVSRLFSDKERTLAIGIFNSESVIGTTIAPLLGTLALFACAQRYRQPFANEPLSPV